MSVCPRPVALFNGDISAGLAGVVPVQGVGVGVGVGIGEDTGVGVGVGVGVGIGEDIGVGVGVGLIGDGVGVGRLITFIESPAQLAVISVAEPELSVPPEKPMVLVLPDVPMTWKCISARYPEPVTPETPGMFSITLILPEATSAHIPTGTAVVPIRPLVISVTSSTEGS